MVTATYHEAKLDAAHWPLVLGQRRYRMTSLGSGACYLLLPARD
jgi:hypothetical protein